MTDYKYPDYRVEMLFQDRWIKFYGCPDYSGAVRHAKKHGADGRTLRVLDRFGRVWVTVNGTEKVNWAREGF